MMFGASCATTLPAARRFAEAKRRSEAARLSHVAVASRNHMLRAFRQWREARLERLEAAEGAVQRAKHVNVQSMAWQEGKEFLPRPGAGSTFQAGRGRPVNVGGSFVAISARRTASQDALEEKAKARREEAAAALTAIQQEPGGPVTAGAWEKHFEDNLSSFTQDN